MRFIKSPMGAMLFVISVCLVTTLIFQACRKMDTARGITSQDDDVSRFLAIRPGTDTAVQAIATTIRRHHETRGTIHKLVKNAGYALWHKAKVFRKGPGDGERLYIPFVKDGGNQTTAVLMVKIKDRDTLFHLLYASHYADYGFEQNSRRWNGKEHLSYVHQFRLCHIRNERVYRARWPLARTDRT